MIRRMRNWLMVVTAAIFALMGGGINVYAELPQATQNFYAQNDILFYDPYGGCTTAPTPVLGRNVTWIGDSYSEGAEASGLISGRLAGVDLGDYAAGAGEQPAGSFIKSSKAASYGSDNNPSGITILQNIVNAGRLRPYLVFALGTNGADMATTVDRVVNIAGSTTDIVFVTAYTAPPHNNAYEASNAAVRAAAEQYSNVRVADWAAVARDEYYAADPTGVHPFSNYEDWVNVIYEALASFTRGTNGTTVVNNQNYAGDTVWTDEQLAAIEANRQVYEKAEQQYGIPWQAIATMHSLETNLLKVNPANGQGIYQLYTYTVGGTNGNAFLPVGPVSDEEFERQTMIAAEQMKQMIEGQGLSVDSDEGIKSLLFQYNGRSPRYIEKALALGFSEAEANIGEGSPYVMNRYDARRDPNSSEMDPAWPGRYVADNVFEPSATQADFGGFVKYIALAGSSNGGNYCNGAGSSGGNMDLNASAIELAWPESEAGRSFVEPAPAYVAAMQSTGIAAEADPNGDGIWDMAPRRMGMSCDMFVGTVVRYSGVDPNFPYTLGAQKDYLANSEMWEELYVTDSSQYQGGDIRIEYGGGHISMVVEIDGELKIASASAFERFGDIGSFYMNDNLTYRLKR